MGMGMSPVLDIGLLRSFVAIADHGGFIRAADALHLSQPTVSQHVRQLEHRIGKALVEKDGRQSRFTRSGELLLIEARHILAVHDSAVERLESPSKPVVSIGATEIAAQQVLPAALSALQGAYPNHDLRFEIDRSTQMTVAVKEGRLDLAVVFDLDESIKGETVASLPLIWLAAADRQVPGGDAVVPIVAYRPPCVIREHAIQRLQDSGRQAQLTCESGTLEGVLAAARAGLGIAVLPSTGLVPHGLVICSGLPPLGRIDVKVAARPGLPAAIGRAAVEAISTFFRHHHRDLAALEERSAAGEGRHLGPLRKVS